MKYIDNERRTDCEDLGYCPHGVSTHSSCMDICGVGRDDEYLLSSDTRVDSGTLELLDEVTIRKYHDTAHNDYVVTLELRGRGDGDPRPLSLLDDWDAVLEQLYELLQMEQYED